MGLDVTAYEHVGEPSWRRGDMPDGKFWDLLEELGGLYVYNLDAFHGREAPLERGCVYHTSGRTLGFGAGSYSGYGIWRAELLRFAALPELSASEILSQNLTAEEDEDFYELIWFADNEGVIGSVASRNLLDDFERNYERARTWLPSVPEMPFLERYQKWTEAFRLVSTDGAVDFH